LEKNFLVGSLYGSGHCKGILDDLLGDEWHIEASHWDISGWKWLSGHLRWPVLPHRRVEILLLLLLLLMLRLLAL
jgi:hypothetical protein